MSKNNVRIAIRDSTDSHNVAFFDNEAGIKYKSANLQRFLAGSASILTLKYNSKDIDSIRSGCKLAFRYKARDYWLNVMNFEKKGFEVELTAYSLGLELNNETRGEHKPANAMSIAEYVAYYDQEHALTIGVNEVSDKRIKLEWTGTDTILARLFSIANSFGAELDFNVELNDDYSLKRQVLNIYKKGNLGTNKVIHPVRVGKELKVINYSDNIKELRTAVRATGKDGLTIDGLNKKIYDSNKQLLYYSSGMTVYAPQSRDRFPSVGKGSNDNWIVEDLGETQYETKEALWGYMYGEIQKKSLPEITYEAEGTIEAGIGDTQTLIDDIHFEPALYVQARVSELEDDILTGKVTNSTFINFERKYSQIADSLLRQVEALAEDAAPYIVRLSTDNGYNFKNGQGTSTITAKLEKYGKIVNANWKWLINNSIVSETSSVTINASQVIGTLNVVAVASVDGNEVAREYITFTNSDDGVGIKSIKRYYTTNDQSEGVTAGGQNWATKPTTVTTDKKYMWSYDVITYTNDTSLVTEPAVIGARGDDGLDADTTGITEALDKAKQDLTALSANLEKVRDDSLAAVEEAKQQLTTVANDLSKAKTDLQNAVSAVDTKADNLTSDLTKAKSDLNTAIGNVQATVTNQAKTLQEQASQLTTQASAQSELTKRVSTVEETANGTKATVSELSKTVDSNTNNITSVSNRTKTVETGLTSAKTSISELQTRLATAQTDLTSISQRTKTVEDDLSGTKTTLTNLSQTVTSDGKNIASLTSRTKTVEDSVDGLKTTMSSVQKDLTSTTARTKAVEDDLSGTKTTLSQVKTTADSTSQKTATLETGLNGLSAKFDNLTVGAVNLFKGSRDFSGNWVNSSSGVYAEDYQGVKIFKKQTAWNGLSQYFEVKTGEEYVFSAYVKSSAKTDGVNFYLNHDSKQPKAMGRVSLESVTNQDLVSFGLTDEYQRIVIKIKITSSGWIMPRIERYDANAYLFFGGYKLERGNVATDYSPNEADIESKVAEYKQTADQNYASLQSTVQALDGTVTANKATADQTAAGFKTRIESLETYKDGETTRASQYFELAKSETARQLTAERTAIANNYVAKSTYTSDVTGIRNDLTATTTTSNTTKTNLANYQASNDKAVANLQSNLQTANGNISSLQTKVEAVPGQITSAVSAVEGKIPTSVSQRNLVQGTSDVWSPFVNITTNNNWTYDLATVTYGDSTGIYAGTTINIFVYLSADEILLDSSISPHFFIQGAVIDKSGVETWTGWNKYHPFYNKWSTNLVAGNNYKVVKLSTKVTSESYSNINGFKISVRIDGAQSGKFHHRALMVTTGDVFPANWSPAPEDAIRQISAVSSELKQTKDGMTLLATKTELNAARSDLQSGISTATSKADNAQAASNNNAQTISTHTTQISALNTGLQAKVSQSDFNTLSGRVTTAESNLTATANELSSKISSVEGKIPKNVGGANLFKGSRDFSGNWVNSSSGVYAEDYRGVKIFKKQSAWLGLSQYFEVKAGEEYVFSAYVKSSAKTDGVSFYLFHESKQPMASGLVSFGSVSNKDNIYFELTDEYQRIVIKIKITSDGWIMPRLERGNTNAYLFFGGYKLERGNVTTDWTPAPEDYDSKLASAQSEIKQTTDSISAAVSSVETKANTAQSTANTAVSKADAAQAGVNTLDSTTVKSASLTINTDGIVMKAGKSTTDVANAIGSYFAVNQNAINLFSDKINVKGSMIVDGAITSTKIAAGAITADKIQAGSITADMFKGNQITSLNGATTLNLYTGEIIFNNQYATINQIKGSYKSQISLSSVDYKAVNESAWSSVNMLAFNSTKLTSATRRAGSAVDMFSKFSLMTLYGEKIAFTGETSGIPNSQNAIIVNTNSDDVNFTNSQTNSSEGAWNYSMIMDFGANAAISAPDIKLAGHFKSLTGILDDLCKKVGVMWI
ncbi:Chromosome partition protein Smc [Streptococcus infantarius subsp. infantarius]|nr:Chromosome partition protein Smc [Streptococcus infantarius subsp. infantarius]